MSLFDSYDHIPTGYIPNNKDLNTNDIRTPIKNEVPPYVDSVNNKIVGYYWTVGDKFSFTYAPSYSIFIDNTALTVTAAPTSATVGFRGQYAYNVATKQIWICTAGYDGTSNMWTELTEFTHSVNGIPVLLTNISWGTKNIIFEIKNARHETIYTKEYIGSSLMTIDIDDDISKLLRTGVYYFRFTMEDRVPNDNNFQHQQLLDEFFVTVCSSSHSTNKKNIINPA